MNMAKRFFGLGFRHVAFACILASLSACAWMQHDTAPRAEIQQDKIKLAQDIHLAGDNWPDAQWWKQYNDPQLNALIERALSDSPTIAIARTRVSQAASQTELLGAGNSLQISALALLNEQHTSSNGFLGPYALDVPRLGLTGPWYTEGTLGLFADWNIDIWGAHRAAIEAALGVQNARAAEAASAELEISSGVAQLYYSMQTTWQMIDLLRQTRVVLDDAVVGQQNKMRQGLESKTPIFAARTQVLAVDRQITAAQGQLKGMREAMRALVGAGADDLPEIRPAPLPQIVGALPRVLSYELLARRADLQAMRWYVQSSFSQIDAAKAAFYPNLDLKVLFGIDSIHLNKLFQSSSQQFNLIPGLYLPIFDGGRLNANLHGARAASNMLIEQYNQAVLNAVRDVAVSGSRLQALDDERLLQVERLDATQFAQEAAEASFKRGLSSRLASTEAHLPILTEKMALLLLDGQRLNQDIALIKALGGGYRSEPPAATAGSALGEHSRAAN